MDNSDKIYKSKNFLDPEDIEWVHFDHITFSKQHHWLDRDERFGIQREVLTNRDGHGWSGKPKRYYYIDGCDREFTDIQEMCDCFNELRDFDDPHNEIVWVKRIVPKGMGGGVMVRACYSCNELKGDMVFRDGMRYSLVIE